MTTKTESVAYKCPSCGGSLEYSALTYKFTCHYCGSAYDKEELDGSFSEGELVIEESFSEGDKVEAAAPDEKWTSFNNLYNCPSCGAGIITDSASDVSVRCHYCNSPVVLAGRLSGEFRPDKIIPFKKTREFAEEAFKEWSGKRFFVPKDFKSERTLAEMKGVYVPFWLADCCVEGDVEAVCTIDSSSRRGDTITTTHREYFVKRKGSFICSGVPADGSAKAADLLMENIEPFDYGGLVDFDMSYLSGHSAEKYDIGKNEIYPRIKQRVCEEASELFKSTIKGYTSVRIKRNNFRISGINWTYALLPVWFLSYHYKGELYCYAMNGQTGKFSGRLPLNKLKLAAVTAAVIVGLLGILGFVAFFG